MKGLFISLLFVFTLRDQTGSRNVSVYLDINSYQEFSLVLQNDAVQRNVFLKFVRLEMPQDVFVNVCARGICNPYDTCTVRNVMPFEEVSIDVTLFSGQSGGSVNAYLLAFDTNNPSVRDSVIFSGIIPVAERGQSRIYYRNGMIYGHSIKELAVFDASGRLLHRLGYNGLSEVSIDWLGMGIFFIVVRDGSTSQLIKVVKVK